jgi:hypothetical protein
VTTQTIHSIPKTRLQKIADQLEAFANEIEEIASDLEDSPACDALFQASGAVNGAATILEKLSA